ncbi:MAG: hypothetical protein QNK04_06355 [Myxococcota bacterium]|nr:hypothetical protein [Myxococcota bacterium]
MVELHRAKRCLPLPWTALAWLAVALLAAGCQSTPSEKVSISSRSSLLAVDVVFPAPLRDPALVQAFLVKGPIHGGMPELPELVPPTFVKRSRAYWLDLEPGTYSVVAVTSAYSPPWNERPIGGVTKTRWSGTSADALIFSSELIRQTRTTIAPGRVAFMGELELRQGERINARTAFREALQERLAEKLRPGVTAESGLSGWLKRTWTVDPEKSTIRDGYEERAAFLEAAIDDLGTSPWAEVVARDPAHQAAIAETAAPRRRRAPARAAPPRAAPAQPRSEPAPRTAPVPARAPSQHATPAAEPRTALVEHPAPAAEPTGAATAAATEEPHGEGLVAPGATLDAGVAAAEAAQGKPVATAAAATAPATRMVGPRLPPPPPRERVPGIPASSPLSEVEIGMSHEEVQDLLGTPDERIDRTTAKAWIPFHRGPGAFVRDWVYDGEGRVVFSVHGGALEVLDVVYEPGT